jgi:hypothetical protein
MTHHCHAKGCAERVSPKLLMCRPHWFMVPRELQREVWAHYVPGQEVRKDPTPDYLTVMQRAIDAVAAAEEQRAARGTLLKALTLIQPWGFSIMWDGKAVENRTWAPPSSMLGKRFAVHAGKKVDERVLGEMVGRHFGDERLSWQGILGTVELVGYVRPDCSGEAAPANWPLLLAALESPWRAPDAKVLWVLRDPRPLAEPIACPGAQGLWVVPTDIAERMRALEVV